jgi:cobalt-zinc-cadmium efflux system membrane fusion protein
MEQRAEITVEPVTEHALGDTIEFSSTIEPTTHGSGVVMPLVSGVITRVAADVGQQVTAGQVLAYMNCPDLADAQSDYLNATAKLQEATAELALVENRVSLVKAEVKRANDLNKEGISAIKDLQAAQSREASTLAELAAAGTLVKAARSHQAAAMTRLRSLGISTFDLSSKNISNELPLRSPVSGTVTVKNVNPGQYISTAFGSAAGKTNEALFTVVDLSKLWAILEVPQSEAAKLKVGTPVYFSSEAAPQEVFQGKVISPGENFDSLARTVGVRVEVANPKQTLKPGTLVLARAFIGDANERSLAVPLSAVQQIDNNDVVFVKDGPSLYETRTVKLGRHSRLFAEVLSGVKYGDAIVNNGSFVLKSEALKASLSANGR